MHRLSTTSGIRLDGEQLTAVPGSFGMEREEWYAEARRLERAVVVSMTAPNPRRALAQLAASDDPFDRWFKDQLRDLTGAELPTLFGRALAEDGQRH